MTQLNKDAITELATRVLALKEGCIETDKEIYLLLFCRPTPADYKWHGCDVRQEQFPLLHRDGCPTNAFMVSAPRFTSSIDAASSLVPTGHFSNLRLGTWWWSVNSLCCAAHVAYENCDTAGIPEFSASANTPALALAAAALEACAELIEDKRTLCDLVNSVEQVLTSL